MKHNKALLLSSVLCAATTAGALEISLGAEGVALKSKPPVGAVRLDWPRIGIGEAYSKPSSVSVTNHSAYLAYPNGVKAVVALAQDGKFTMNLAAFPAGSAGGLKISHGFMAGINPWKGAVKYSMTDPSGGGVPSEADSQLQAFPEQKHPGAFLKRGDLRTLAIAAPGASEGFKISLPFGYQHLADRREWGDDQRVFWETFSHLPADAPYVWTVGSADGTPVTLGEGKIVTTDDIYVPYPPAQEALWPGKGPIRTFGWQEGIRRNYFNARAKDQNAIVFVGDSLTENWRTLKADFAPYKAANRGVGGDTSRGILFRLKHDVIALNPQIVFICAGANDMTAHGAPAHTLSNLEDIIKELRAYNGRLPIVISTLPPSSNPQAPLKPDSRETVNKGIFELPEKYANLHVYDLSAAMMNAAGGQELSYFAKDRLHLDKPGYAVWKEGLLGVLKKILEPKNNAEAGKIDLSEFVIDWRDEFDGAALDPAKWEAPVQTRTQGASSWHPRNVSVADGALTIKVTKAPGAMRYDAACIRSSKGYSPEQYLYAFKHGYVEARMKMPKNIARADYWVGFWMLCGDVVAGRNADTRKGVEIDILETFDMNRLGALKHTLHWGGYGATHNAQGFASGPNLEILNDDWHTYGLLWDAEKYVFYIDGAAVCETDARGLGSDKDGKTKSLGVSEMPGYIKLSVEAAPWCGPTSNWEKSPPAEDALVVDYVRVYKRK